MLPGGFLESGVLEWFERVKFEQVMGREVKDLSRRETAEEDTYWRKGFVMVVLPWLTR